MKKIITTLTIFATILVGMAATRAVVYTSDGQLHPFEVETIDSIGFVQDWTFQKYVDLGLTSGTLWARCNLGAFNPEESGGYFSWGETSPKEEYSWSTYKYGTSTSSYSKYNATDNLKTLESSDDAATAVWGEAWCIPTVEQMQELIAECTWTWIVRNGVNGMLVTGKNGNSIFLPAAGGRSGTRETDLDCGDYYSRSLRISSSVYVLRFTSESVLRWDYSSNRVIGYAIRPVRAN